MPSESGDQFILATRAAFGPGAASGENTYGFSRHPSGWSFSSLAAPGLGIQSLGLGGVGDRRDRTDSPASPSPTRSAPPRARPASPPPLCSAPPAAPTPPCTPTSPATFPLLQRARTQVIGASADLSHLILLGTATRSPKRRRGAELDEGAPALFESDAAKQSAAEN